MCIGGRWRVDWYQFVSNSSCQQTKLNEKIGVLAFKETLSKRYYYGNHQTEISRTSKKWTSASHNFDFSFQPKKSKDNPAERTEEDNIAQSVH